MTASEKNGRISPHASYRLINGILDKAGFSVVEHHAINVNGRKDGCSGFWKNDETGRMVYVNTDVELPGEKHTVLVRDAEDIHDCHGWNRFTDTREGLLKLARSATSNDWR